jgi:hypothetical protein
MITQIVLLLAVVIALGAGLALLGYVLSRSITPPAEHVTVPIEDAREHLPR